MYDRIENLIEVRAGRDRMVVIRRTGKVACGAGLVARVSMPSGGGVAAVCGCFCCVWAPCVHSSNPLPTPIALLPSGGRAGSRQGDPQRPDQCLLHRRYHAHHPGVPARRGAAAISTACRSCPICQWVPAVSVTWSQCTLCRAQWHTVHMLNICCCWLRWMELLQPAGIRHASCQPSPHSSQAVMTEQKRKKEALPGMGPGGMPAGLTM